MGRYTGPKTKVARRYGVPLFGPSKSLERKNYPPGMHGPKGSRRKQSDYAVALGEKQKLRFQYGLMEKQFRRIFATALQRRGVTGETLLQLLETRLDNVIFRLGLANTRSAARQLVSHGHVQVNGKNVNISSFNVKAGDEITVKDRPKSGQLALPFQERERLVVAGAREKVRELWVDRRREIFLQRHDRFRNLLEPRQVLRGIAPAGLVRDDREPFTQRGGEFGFRLVHRALIS